MDVVFDPLELTKEASLNRTRLAELPGADPRLATQLARSLLALQALGNLAFEHGIRPVELTAVPWQLSKSLRGMDTAHTDETRRVVAEFGRRLGHLVATLRVGREEKDASPWRTAYRQHWKSVDRVWLGGGIAAALGSGLLLSARAEAERLGVEGSTIELSPHADVLALIGAARTLPRGVERAIVLDFGYSSVKRGIATFRANSLVHLDVLRSLPPPRPGLDVRRAIVDVIRTTFFEAQPAGIYPEVVVSLATYVHDRRTTASSELYDLLSNVDFQELQAELQPLMQVRFMHDGTAAAAGLPSSARDGVVVLGTSLGAGFTLPEHRRLPVAIDLQVQPW